MGGGLGRAGWAWVHLPGEDPDSQGWTFGERVQKGWGKRTEESTSGVKSVTPKNKPRYKG